MSQRRLWGFIAAAAIGLSIPAFTIYCGVGGGLPVILAVGLDGTLGGIGLGGLVGMLIAHAEEDFEEEAALAMTGRFAIAHS